MDYKLFNAVLSMDSYNRGYGQSIQISGNQIGVATIQTDSLILGTAIINGQTVRNDQQKGFYAVAYNVSGAGRIIAYRGTDDALDPIFGWPVALGVPGSDQGIMAFEFYRLVAGEGDPRSAPISVTGHSLGGGLAGLVGSVYNKEGLLFDNMPFEDAANETDDFALIHSSVKDIVYGVYNGGVPWAPIISAAANSNLQTHSMDGEFLEWLRPGQVTPETSYSIPGNPNLAEWFPDAGKLHSMASLVIRMFAETEIAGEVWWHESSKHFWTALYNDNFARSIGVGLVDDQNRTDGYDAVLRTIIAYSSIDNGDSTISARPFGDTAIRAMYHDANELGKVLALPGVSQVLVNAAGDIGKSFVQFAGQMALSKVLKDEHGNVLKGVLTYSDLSTNKSLTVNFDDAYWRTGIDTSDPINYIGRAALAGNILLATGNEAAIRTAMYTQWGDRTANVFDSVTFATQESWSIDLTHLSSSANKANLFVGGIGADYVTGSTGNDLLLGSAGDDSLNGGDGNDVLVGGAGQNYIDGGSGVDSYVAQSTGVYLRQPHFTSHVLVERDISGNPMAAIPAHTHAGIDTVHNTERYVLTSGNDYSNVVILAAGAGIDGGTGVDTYSAYGTIDLRQKYGAGSFGVNGIEVKNFEKLLLTGDNVTIIPDESRSFVNALGRDGNGHYIINNGMNIVNVGSLSLDYSGASSQAVFDLSNLISVGLDNDIVTINGQTHRYGEANAVDKIFSVRGTNHGDTAYLRTNLSTQYPYGYGDIAPTAVFTLGKGNDVVYNLGERGQHIIYTGGVDNVYGSSSVVRFTLAPDILISDVSVNWAQGQNLLTVSVDGRGSITFHDFSYGGSSPSFSRIYFGTSVNFEYYNILSNTIIDNRPPGAFPYQARIEGTWADDNLHDSAGLSSHLEGGVGNDTLYGHDEDDLLIGGDGDDTYVFALGDGHDVISDARGFDAIQISSALTADQILFSKADPYDYEHQGSYFIRYSSTDSIEIKYQIDTEGNIGPEAVERLVLANGTVFDLTRGLPWTGTSGQDWMQGTKYDDKLTGMAGDDTLEGGLGNDIYYFEPGSGMDLIVDAGGDQDKIRIGQGLTIHDVRFEVDYYNLNILFGLSDVIVIEGHYLEENGYPGGFKIETLEFDNGTTISLLGDIPLIGTHGDDYLSGTSGNNVLYGLAGNDYLWGGDGDDYLEGGDGDDELFGGSGIDTLSYASASAGVTLQMGTISPQNTIGAGIDTLRDRFEKFLGSAHGDTLSIDSSNHYEVDMGAGNDTFIGGAVFGLIDGGLGADTYQHSNLNVGITISLSSTSAQTLSPGMGQMVLSNFENVTSTNQADSVTGSAQANVLKALNGHDTINGLGGDDRLEGGAGNDIYIYSQGDGFDTIYDISGNDEIRVGAGYIAADMATRLSGNDLIISLKGSDVIKVESFTTGSVVENVRFSNGVVVALSAPTSINGTSGNDTLLGTSANEVLSGYNGDDTLDGAGGADVLVGGAGNDTYYVYSINDVIVENASAGTDIVYSSASYVLSANVERLFLTGSASINGTGNGSGNRITGNSGDNILDGGAGADTLIGGTGNDTYILDNSSDTVTELAGEGIDLIQSSTSRTLSENVENLTLTGMAAINGTGNALDNIIIGNSAANTLNGKGGSDTLIGGLGDDTYVLEDLLDIIVEHVGEGNDTVRTALSYTLGAHVENLTLTDSNHVSGTGNALNNVISGNWGNNTLNGAEGDDTLSGGAGQDTLNGGAGADIMRGGTGHDLYIVDNEGDIVIELASEGTDSVQAWVSYTLSDHVENMTLVTSLHIDATGNGLNNTLTGNAGNNVLDGQGGADIMAGGHGDDIYVVDNIGDVVTEGASAGTDTVRSSITYILPSNVERLELLGHFAINGTGNALNNRLTGNGADNILNGGAGSDTLIGGQGNDTYYVDHSGDVVTELDNEGIDHVHSSISYTLSNHTENLTLTGNSNINAGGNSLDNILVGNSGSNTLNGQVGADTMIGGLGDDIYVVDSINDIIVEEAGEGHDTVQSSVTHTLSANVENLSLTASNHINGTGNALDNVINGNWGENTLRGGSGNDYLAGRAGNDYLYGEDGMDTLIADAGNDRLFGGSGADTFLFTTDSLGGSDFIKDFSAAELDVIDVKALLIDYDPLTKVLTDYVELSNSGSNTLMKIDRDGAGTAYGWTQIATIEGVTGMTDEAAQVSAGRLIVS